MAPSSDTLRPFADASTMESDPSDAAHELASALADAEGSVGLLYVSETMADGLSELLAVLGARTKVQDWVAAVGHGVVSSDDEIFGRSAASALVMDLPADGYHLFSGGADTGRSLISRHREWIQDAAMPLLLTHADPTNRETALAIQGLPEETGGFLIGGLTAAVPGVSHLAGSAPAGTVSGLMIAPAASEIATALTQGCSPISEPHRITAAQGNVLLTLDGRPALDVFKEDIGEVLARDLRRCAGYIFAGLPVHGSDTRDYTVRNLVGIDPEAGALAIGDHVEEGDEVLFCRRDRDSAVEDMGRMLDDLDRRVRGRPIRGGIYISCAARGPNQFEEPHREIDLIRERFGTIPLTGFFANGEFSRDRLYAYTGVLTLFL